MLLVKDQALAIAIARNTVPRRRLWGDNPMGFPFLVATSGRIGHACERAWISLLGTAYQLSTSP